MDNLSVWKHRYQLSPFSFYFSLNVFVTERGWKVKLVVCISRYLERQVARDIDLWPLDNQIRSQYARFESTGNGETVV